jgi:GNAT superfamily N-acetyltransferase
MNIRIVKLNVNEADEVFSEVLKLLAELGEEGDELGELSREKILSQWQHADDRFQVLGAKNPDDKIVGVLTLVETFAIYANGNYGIINEMYTDPSYRSAGIGAMLVQAAIQYGRKRGWSRIDVTAPESERWARTKHFYEKQGFVFTGPKLKFLLTQK